VRWNNKSTIAELYTENSVLHDNRVPAWFQGRSKIASFVIGRFRAGYQITPVSYSVDGTKGYIAGYLTRGTTHIGHVHLSLEKGTDGLWRIAAESITFPGPQDSKPFTAEQLIRELDAAKIQKGVVLSAAYWFGDPRRETMQDEYARVRAENDWVAEQVTGYPNRLVAFCSFNPLKDYALEELSRCAKNPNLKGLKLHFGNSEVDVRKPEHLEKLRQVFRAVNKHRLPIVAHLWTVDPTYGKEHSEIFLNQILPEAPDIVIQIAHMAGGGRSTDSALAVFADAIAAKDPRTKNLYFDIATLVVANSPDQVLQKDAERMRQIGLNRILWGSDFAEAGLNDPSSAGKQWLLFRAMMPLTDDELRTIAGNVAPYLR
jgi:predicted TIM-barrel fold metal-dependent hydrolase